MRGPQGCSYHCRYACGCVCDGDDGLSGLCVSPCSQAGWNVCSLQHSRQRSCASQRRPLFSFLAPPYLIPPSRSGKGPVYAVLKSSLSRVCPEACPAQVASSSGARQWWLLLPASHETVGEGACGDPSEHHRPPSLRSGALACVSAQPAQQRVSPCTCPETFSVWVLQVEDRTWPGASPHRWPCVRVWQG